ncbi:MAG: hypothetical protein H0X53_09160 [Sphingomonas sp.]|nr:hypothetical protein [Sphingomonas sp.]
MRVGASTLHLDGERRRNGVESSNSLGRTRGLAAANLDLPISRRNGDFSALGNLTFNVNGEVEQLSDFGTLTTVGAGLNWSPAQRLDLLASWTREDGAPSVQQLGDPILETPGSRIFDFTTGETIIITAITGGNPALDSDSRNVFKLGANWKPLEETDLRFRGDYVSSRIDRPISSFPGPTAAIEAAFPERFVRNPQGDLLSVDLRPVSFDSARRDTLRLGLDFSKPLRSAPPSQAAIEAMRARRAASGEGRRGGAPGNERGVDPAGPERAGPAAGLGRMGGGRFGGGRNGGRLTFSLTDTITLIDEVTIRQGLPKLDYLDGDAVGQAGGRPRHDVEARRIFQQWPGRAAFGQLAKRHSGRKRDRRRASLLAAIDGQPQAVGERGAATRPGCKAPLAARHVRPFPGRQFIRQQAKGAKQPRRCSVQLSARSSRPARAGGQCQLPQAVPSAAGLLQAQ